MTDLDKTSPILAVDDDPMIRDLVRVILEAEGYEVISAADGKDAVQIIDSMERPVDISCVILDIQMPGLNGFDVLTRLKLHPDTSDIPVVMLTCQSTTEDFVAGYQFGADYYITKPFTRDQLLYGLQMFMSGRK